MKFSAQTLMAYTHGEVDARTRDDIEAALPRDADVAARIARHRTLQSSLRTTFAPVLHDAVPERLLEAARRTAAEQSQPAGWQTALQHLHAWHWAAVASFAALALGVMLGRLNLAPPAPVTTFDGRMFANAALATALSTQTGATELLQSEVVVGLSYLSKSGVYCRTFTLKERESIAGIACREAEGWRIQVLAQTDPKSPLAQYRMAGIRVPPLIMATVENAIDGSPLNAEAEAAARQRDWRR